MRHLRNHLASNALSVIRYSKHRSSLVPHHFRT
jgi:hypothetical protein